jgi:hypothetical protein
LTKFILIVSTIFFTKTLQGQTLSPIVAAGSIVNAWTQGSVRSTEKPFDLAIQGKGFFVLQQSNGEHAFSRYGEMSLNSEGFLVHSASQNIVLGYCGANLESINLSRFAQDTDGSVVKSFTTELDGTIVAFYANGTVHKTCSIALAIFQNSSKLERIQHILKATHNSGRAAIGVPLQDGRGSIFGASLEMLDEPLYRLNIISPNTDRVAVEMEKAHLAMEQWGKQKTLFYIFELKMNQNDLEQIEKAEASSGEKIQRLVAAMAQKPPQMSQQEYDQGIRDALDEEEAVFQDIAGLNGLEEAKKFREAFNKNLLGNFGTSINITGF